MYTVVYYNSVSVSPAYLHPGTMSFGKTNIGIDARLYHPDRLSPVTRDHRRACVEAVASLGLDRFRAENLGSGQHPLIILCCIALGFTRRGHCKLPAELSAVGPRRCVCDRDFSYSTVHVGLGVSVVMGTNVVSCG